MGAAIQTVEIEVHIPSVLQHPSRNHPVNGSDEHFCNSVPLTLIESCIMPLPQLKSVPSGIWKLASLIVVGFVSNVILLSYSMHPEVPW